ncbi:hypothetical protein Val02_63100 [Virgisporangium aliadipatigenens]|uniref:Uncharacterized protein n=1 Tax=Virgisporangium aliadipatigenens TaxID=741659 RepID=A0A8J3YPR4_9ACTN|nr:hypothetical protein [Virgisporangium aliadipatigenens]GIJ49424.1 hypothetical protein Val02_63100 [Virgisporangium aliadipatigenens]
MGDRVAALRDLLNEWDFIGVFDPKVNTDEYDCMIVPLLTCLSAGAEAAAVEQFLNEEITDHFGMPETDTAPVAARIVRWWATTE